ncbi:MAG: DNA polymerase III subunit alpha [Ferrimicrobium sp.]
MQSFVHLHTHTEYSMLDGAARLGALLDRAKQDGQRALAITDHGNMYGVLDFYKEARKREINPIIGLEAYMARESRHERPVRRGRIDDTGGDNDRGEKLYYHLILLAENNAGYQSLIQLASRAFLEGYYYKPRLDWELLAEHHNGLIATTGCLGGLVLQHLLRDDYNGARQVAGRLQDIFGVDNLMVEIQDHGLPEQRRTNPELIRLAKDIGAPLVATNDSHYTHREDHVAHDALLCIQTGAVLSDEKRFRFHGSEHYLKTAEEMRTLFSEVPEACTKTEEIGERCDVTIEFGSAPLPTIPIPESFRITTSYSDTATSYLRHLTLEGALRRYGDSYPVEISERIDFELSVIASMEFSGYFLVVWDLICYAKERGIRVGPGRGSAAGSVVAYCLGIVELDPIRYDLLFERFLNPGRKQMPDIDMDFDERYRSQMIKYATERYGSDHVAQIVTFSTIKARAAVRDASRVLGLPYSVGDRIAKAMPPLVMGRDTPLAACLELIPGMEDGYKMATELRQMRDNDPEVERVLSVAAGLEGLRRGDGIHAAAVVITHEPLTTYLPIQRKSDPGTPLEDSPVVTQYEMHGVEELGLLKMDFLGLRTLSVIDRAIALIKESSGVEVDIDTIALDDERTLSMLRDADTIGVFQLEGGPMRALVRSLAPTRFDDIAALVALYRPGPMAANMHNDYADRKNGRKPITYLHPDLEELLGDTYGLMIYQESVMRVAQKFAGYSLAEAENLRKACGKKIRELITAEREKFVDGCEQTGYGRKLGNTLFDIIEPFADYAFNKSHSYGYGLVAYQTAWLKANYPVQYLAAMMTSVRDDKDKTAVYLADAASHQIPVKVPSINHSHADFTIVTEPDGSSAILFGLAAIRNVGESLVGLIVNERNAHGPFHDFGDLCARVDPMVLNKRTIESLIKAGAFDTLGHTRLGLMEIYEATIDHALDRRKDFDRGIGNLFEDPVTDDASPIVINVNPSENEWPRSTRLQFEREMLGLYVSSHPLVGFERQLSRIDAQSVSDLVDASEHPAGMVTVVGVVTSLSTRHTKKGELMGTFSLEDLRASVNVMVFPKAMGEFGHLLAQDSVYRVTGRLDTREDRVQLVASAAERITFDTDATPIHQRPLVIRLRRELASRSELERLKEVLGSHEGLRQVHIAIEDLIFDLGEDLKVADDNGLAGHLLHAFGDRITIESTATALTSA